MGTPTVILAPSSCRYAVALTAGVNQTITVPAGANAVLFNSTAPFWLQYGAAATLPTANDVSGNAPELAPQARRIAAGTSLGLIAPASCLVSLSFFRS